MSSSPRTALRMVVALSALLLASASAHAQISRHESVTLSPIKKEGHTVGFKLNAILRPEGKFSVASLRVGVAASREETMRTHGPAEMRLHAAGTKPGYLQMTFPEVEGLTNQPHEVSYKVMYGDHNTLKAGDRVDIYSFWHTPGGANDIMNGNSTHIFGFFGDQKSTFQLP